MTYVAHWWSMDGARLAYLTINNSATPVMEIPHFLGGLYPSNVVFPYPKVKKKLIQQVKLSSKCNLGFFFENAPESNLCVEA